MWPSVARVTEMGMQTGNKKHPKSQSAWEGHYMSGGGSAIGASGRSSAEIKGDLITSFVRAKKINSIADVGFGDGSLYNR